MKRAQFVEGPAGSGKTSYAVNYVRSLITEQGARPEHILLLVPQRILGRPYQIAFSSPEWPGGAEITPVTIGGLARRSLELFWPLVAEQAGFAHPTWEPGFLTIETAQYFMAQFVNEAVETGVFDSISVTPFRIMNQTLDNLSKAAMNQFSLDEVASRLIAGWGDRHSSRPPVYRASVDLAARFREHCLQNSLLDFSLQIDLFVKYLLREPVFSRYFKRTYRHLVADNLEENFPVVADFVRWAWDDLDSALLVYDSDAGYRSFLGADPAGMHDLIDLCDDVLRLDPLQSTNPAMLALAAEFSNRLGSAAPGSVPAQTNPLQAVQFSTHTFYPQMIDWTTERIGDLIAAGVPPREIVVLAPFLGDSLRFSLIQGLEERRIPVVSHRPSRAVRDEPAARTVLALMSLANPEWGYPPPPPDIADALGQVIDELDPARAWLLTSIVYKQHSGELGSFDVIEGNVQQRITYRAGERYEGLRQWLVNSHELAVSNPPDVFISYLFGEILSQPGFGYHADLEAGRVIAELVESARKFRQTLYPHGVDDWSSVSKEYVTLVRSGLLAALYVASWHAEDQDAVFISPAYTFLMRNRPVDYQFWLDVGSTHWWERLEQPLTHPYVLSRNYPAGQIWTDDLEYAARREALRRLVVGLARRCRESVFAVATQLGEQGYEQQGPLLLLLEQLGHQYATG
ncbi:MAG: hypothetical protein GX573_07355 [Chloroflexi bacterium]|nr:hypothetical protein [Chloroflexota bacterium]